MTQRNSYDSEALAAEQDYAHDKWGDEFDDRNTLNDWVTYATMYATDAARMDNIDDPEKQYAFMLKAACLCMAAATRIREGRLAMRHYDANRENNPQPSGHGEGRAFDVSQS